MLSWQAEHQRAKGNPTCYRGHGRKTECLSVCCRFTGGAACAAPTARSATSVPQHPNAQPSAASAGCYRAAILVSLKCFTLMLASRFYSIQKIADGRTTMEAACSCLWHASLTAGAASSAVCGDAQHLFSRSWYAIIADSLACSAGSRLSARLGWRLGGLQSRLRQG